MENDKKTNSWRVIIIGDRNRHGPFKVTRRFLVLLSVCLIALPAIAGGFWLYSRSCAISNDNLTGELATARQSIAIISRERAEFLEEAETLRAEIKALYKKQRTLDTVGKKKELKPVIAKSEPFVSIEKIQIKHDKSNKTLKVRFMIKSRDVEGDYVSGYTFVILNPAPDSSVPCKIYPNTPIVNGLPESYRQGEYFYIARFKHMEGVFASISDESRYGLVSILVYAKDGTLKLKKELSL